MPAAATQPEECKGGEPALPSAGEGGVALSAAVTAAPAGAHGIATSPSPADSSVAPVTSPAAQGEHDCESVAETAAAMEAVKLADSADAHSEEAVVSSKAEEAIKVEGGAGEPEVTNAAPEIAAEDTLAEAPAKASVPVATAAVAGAKDPAEATPEAVAEVASAEAAHDTAAEAAHETVAETASSAAAATKVSAEGAAAVRGIEPTTPAEKAPVKSEKPAGTGSSEVETAEVPTNVNFVGADILVAHVDEKSHEDAAAAAGADVVLPSGFEVVGGEEKIAMQGGIIAVTEPEKASTVAMTSTEAKADKGADVQTHPTPPASPADILQREHVSNENFTDAQSSEDGHEENFQDADEEGAVPDSPQAKRASS